MNIQDLLAGLKSGSIIFNSNGHDRCRWDISGFDFLIDELERTVTFALEQLNREATLDQYGKCDLNMSNFYWMKLNRNLPLNKYLFDVVEGPCSKCSKKLFLMLTSETEVMYVNPIFFGWRDPVLIDKEPCFFKNGRKPVVNTINVSSALIFANHFGQFPEKPDITEHDEGYSLNYHIGRVNISNYLATKNIGYGQVGNTSVEVYVRKDKKKVWITEHLSSSIEDIEYDLKEGNPISDEERTLLNLIRAKIAEYDYIGDISLGVWRWMCADKNTIQELDLHVNNDSEYSDSVECDVEYGKWKITHYDNTDAHKFDGCTIAELELI